MLERVHVTTVRVLLGQAGIDIFVAVLEMSANIIFDESLEEEDTLLHKRAGMGCEASMDLGVDINIPLSYEASGR